MAKKPSTKVTKNTKKKSDTVTLIDGTTVSEAELAHIQPSLRPFAVRLASLTRDPGNARPARQAAPGPRRQRPPRGGGAGASAP